MSGKELLEQIVECYYDEEILTADGLDEAVIGIDVHSMRLIYSTKKVIEILVKDQDMTEQEAHEWYGFNIESAYVGEHTPIWCNDLFY